MEINGRMKRLLSYSVVMFVITIILLLIIPLPAGLVDVAIILNMSLSMMILVITMTIREPLEFSIFPSLLLITTLFRLGINVSTTRNILSQGGSSGRVIAAFGDFVLRGNVVVGLIIFLIIVLMQFIVITGNPDSPLAAEATICLPTGAPKEVCPLGLTPTTSTTVMTVIGDLLVVGTMKRINFSYPDYAKRHHGGYLGSKSREQCKTVNK